MIDMIDELEDAIFEHDEKRMEKLLKEGADPNGNPEYPLIECAWDEKENSLRILELLLEYGANVEGGYIPKTHDSPLLTATYADDSINTLQLLLNYGANPNVIGDELDSPLNNTVHSKNIENTAILLKYGSRSDINKYRISCYLYNIRRSYFTLRTENDRITVKQWC